MEPKKTVARWFRSEDEDLPTMTEEQWAWEEYEIRGEVWRTPDAWGDWWGTDPSPLNTMPGRKFSKISAEELAEMEKVIEIPPKDWWD